MTHPTELATITGLKEARNFIGGEFVTSRSGKTFNNISPVDGRIAYEQIQTIQNHPVRKIFIMSPKGGPPTGAIELPSTSPLRGSFSWTTDGRGIAFTDTRNGGANIWKVSLDGKADPKPVINFATSQTGGFDWSPNGKQFAATRAISTSEAVLISRIK